MHTRGRGGFGLLILSLALLLAACGGEGSEGSGRQMVQVEVALQNTGAGELGKFVTGTGTAQFGTSLVVVVFSGTSPSPFSGQALGAAIDANLLDLATSTVTLNMPLDEPVQLFEYTFNDTLTLAQALATSQVAGPPNVSTPLTVTADTLTLTVTVPLATASILEGFGGALSPVNWERADAGASVAGGVLKMSASATFDPTATPLGQQEGVATIVRSNRNLMLDNHRVAGVLRIEAFATSDDVVNPLPAQSRAVAALVYQPRASRALGRVGQSVVHIAFQGSTGAGAAFVLEAFTCLTDTCDGGTVVSGDMDFFTSVNFSLQVTATPTAEVPFSLEALGGGAFEGNLNGEPLAINVGGPTFNENDFVYAELMAQGRFMFDAQDSASITAVFDNVAVGNGVVPAILVSPTGGLLTSEAGGSVTFTVVLNSPPTANVTIGLSSSDVTEALISSAATPTPAASLSLVFTVLNWNVPQTVTVTGVDDLVADFAQPFTIITAAAVSTDLVYNGLDAADVAGTNTDNETIVINFDNLPAGICNFASTVPASTEFAALGVNFSGDGTSTGGSILDECGNFFVTGHSSPNFLAFNVATPPMSPQVITFDLPISSFTVSAGTAAAGVTITVTGFDAVSVIVASASLTLSPALAPVTITGVGIVKVVISSTDELFVLDDLTIIK